MKHKNILLVVFFLTLFVFQQVRAEATVSLKENPSQISFAPPYAPLPTINVFVLWLKDDGTRSAMVSDLRLAVPELPTQFRSKVNHEK